MASECKDLNECDKWRSQILREIGGKVMEIQNSSLEEARIRELNDEINKIMRVKHAWEKQILKLGGPNYIKAAAKTSDRGEPPQPHPFPNCFATAAADDSLYFFFLSSRTAGGAEYKYFGAARNLPRRVLLEGHAVPSAPPHRHLTARGAATERRPRHREKCNPQA